MTSEPQGENSTPIEEVWEVPNPNADAAGETSEDASVPDITPLLDDSAHLWDEGPNITGAAPSGREIPREPLD